MLGLKYNMKRFSVVCIIIYFTGLYLTSNLTRTKWSETSENQTRFCISAFHMSETEAQGITGWIENFDKGGNEENVHDNSNFVKKVIGFNPCLISLIRIAAVKYEKFSSQVNRIVTSAPLIILYHAWKFHL